MLPRPRGDSRGESRPVAPDARRSLARRADRADRALDIEPRTRVARRRWQCRGGPALEVRLRNEKPAVDAPSETPTVQPVTTVKLPRVATGIKAGPNRRKFDHIGNFTF